MPVDIEGECGGCVTEVGLDGFYFVSVLECEHGVCVSEVVDSALGDTHLGCYLFIMVI